MKTLSATPRPWYHWKAETLSFLHGLLVWAVTTLTISIKLKSVKTGLCGRYTLIERSQKNRLRDQYVPKIARSRVNDALDPVGSVTANLRNR